MSPAVWNELSAFFQEVVFTFVAIGALGVLLSGSILLADVLASMLSPLVVIAIIILGIKIIK